MPQQPRTRHVHRSDTVLDPICRVAPLLHDSHTAPGHLHAAQAVGVAVQLRAKR